MRNVRVVAGWCMALLVVLAAASADAALWMPKVFGDHMVLQREAKVPVWGKADPGEVITVEFDGKKAAATACPDGKWMVELAKMKAGGPFTMKVTGKNDSLAFQDVLVGEVWVGSGQSNMQWDVQNSNNPQQEIADAKYPEIRLCSVERTVATDPQEDCNASWAVCSPESVPSFSAVLYFFGRDLHKNLDVPIGLIHSSWGGTPAESWTSREMLAKHEVLRPILERWDQIDANYPTQKAEYDKAVEQWTKDAEKAKAEGQPEPQKPGEPTAPLHPHRAAGLYNAMIAPLVPYGIAGAIWYQGESNAGRAFQYRTLFPAMITDWRERWNQGDFPFYFVQLANFTDVLPEPAPSDWAELREAQTMTLGLKNTGMAVIIDIGEAKDIHPRNKQDVGRRLALMALARDYGKRGVDSGPMYDSMKVTKGAAVIKFDEVDGGLVAKGDKLQGFAIAGDDQKFVWADAVIKGKNKVVVSSPAVKEPVAVRYAWAHNPVCNLYNKADLPASPFRTDDWPGVTVNAR